MKIEKTIILILGGLFLWSFAVYAFGFGGEWNKSLAVVLYMSSSFLAVVAAIYAAISYGAASPRGKAFLFLTFGFFFWFLGELVWTIFDSYLGIYPYPSMADLFYLAAYPLLFIGLIREIRLNSFSLISVNKPMRTLMATFAVILGSLVAYFGIYYAYDSASGFLENTIGTLYGVGDFMLVLPSIIILKIALDYGRGKFFYPWFAIFLGFLVTLVADVLFSAFQEQYQLQTFPFNLLDIMWIASYLLFAYGFVKIALLVGKVKQQVKA